MNLSRLAKNEICQECAKCCKEFYWIEYNRDWALRFLLLRHPDIIVEEKKLKSGIVWLIRIKQPCSKLKYENGKYYCEIYDGGRPQFCMTYPDNAPLTEWEIHKYSCPLIDQAFPDVMEEETRP